LKVERSNEGEASLTIKAATFNPSTEARETLAVCQTKLLGERVSLGSQRATSTDPLLGQRILLLPAVG
jgi:hypothetical protein